MLREISSCHGVCGGEMVRWLNNAMIFAMFIAFLAGFAVKPRCLANLTVNTGRRGLG
jgi:hypothetical protein